MKQEFFDPDTVNDRESFIKFVEWLIADRQDAETLEQEAPQRYRWGGANGWQNSSIAAFLEERSPAPMLNEIGVMAPDRLGRTWLNFSISARFTNSARRYTANSGHRTFNFYRNSMSKFFWHTAATAFMVGVMTVSQAQDVGPQWLLRIQDLKHVTKVEATIRFSSEVAGESCMAGAWRRIIVEVKTVQDERFFPLAEPLAYQVNRGDLTLGRTKVCDGYLFLSGKSDADKIEGPYSSVSIMGGQKLGSFTLSRIQ